MNTVFIDVDVQSDFCHPSGALYVEGSPNDNFVALTAFAVQNGIPIVGSVDSHAWDAWEFASSTTRGPNGEKPGFPDHCVKGKPGWLKIAGTLPPRFRFIPNVPALAAGECSKIVSEMRSGATGAVYFEKEVYSLFANPLAEGFLAELINDSALTECIVYGVATDYCVKAAALGLAERGYRTAVVVDAIAEITAEGAEEAFAAMDKAGVRRISIGSIIP